ncbi:MAG: hypothetical protein EBZ48_03850 [Proteobacteria bacterium]|nr:hypothetical protein [Pseudomonadota bacterium]
MNTAKHRKVLRRNFDEMASFGLHNEQLLILRLLYMLATKEDSHRDLFAGIHGLAKLLRSVRSVSPRSLIELFGMPRRTREEILGVINAHRDLVSVIGPELAKQLEFSYPLEIEQKVRSIAVL